MAKSKKYFTLAVLPTAEGQQWSPQFGDYDRDVVAQELKDTRKDWPRKSRFTIISTDGTQAAINAAIDNLNSFLRKGDARNAE
jgi:hypothetical protein